MADVSESSALVELGSTGVNRWGGIITEEFLPALYGQRAWKTYREMSDNDPIIGACLTAIEMIVKQADWSVKAAGDTARDLRAAEFVEQNMSDMEKSWDQFISQAMSMVTFGYAPFEMLYKRRNGNPFDPSLGSKHSDNKIGWRDFALRPQDTIWEWKFDKKGRVEGIVQQAPPDYNEALIPSWKLINFRASYHKDNPEGKSALRSAYRPWYFKKRLEEIEAIGVERDLNGIPIAWVPPGLLAADAGESERATLSRIQDMTTNVRNDKEAGLIMPLQYDVNGNKVFDFELMASRGRRSHDTNGIISRYNRAIASTMLADFILIGHENVGSFALASSKTHLFSVAVGAYLDEIRDVVNKHAVPKLLHLNGMPTDRIPQLEYSDIETIDLDDLARYITAITRDAGLDLSGDNVRDYLGDQAGIPKGSVGVRPQEDEDDFEEDDDNGTV